MVCTGYYSTELINCTGYILSNFIFEIIVARLIDKDHLELNLRVNHSERCLGLL